MLGTTELPSASTWNVLHPINAALLGLLHPAKRDGVEEQAFGLLLTSACRHVAVVALGAAVLMVGAAHSLNQWTAAPLPCGQLAAGGPRGTAALVVTFDVSHRVALGQGLLLPVPGDAQTTLGAGSALGVAGVAAGAAVVPVGAAHSLWQGAAAPLASLVHEAAGGFFGAACVVITHVLGWPGFGGIELGRHPGQCWRLLKPGYAEGSGLVTSLPGSIT